MAPRKTSDERAFQTTQFRRPTMPIEAREQLAMASGSVTGAPTEKTADVRHPSLTQLEKVIWPEPVEHLLPPDEWAPEEADDLQLTRVTQAPESTQTPTRVDLLRPGMIVDGRYRVLDQLGAGGMARILQVLHVDLGRNFALKIIHPGRIEDDRFRKSLLREARVISQLEHPNIVQVTDFGADPNVGVFVVMEYLKGETLYDRLMDEKRLRLPIALDIVLQAAEALRYMHGENLVHRDVKPENIFLARAPEGQRQLPMVKLIDFGLSGPDAKATFKASSGVVGTPIYMAPEQLHGMAPRASMDIYALGVLLYELLTGRPPYVGKLDEIITAHMMEAPKPPSERLDEPLDEAVETLILKALSKRPEDRQSTMAELVYELRTLMDMLGLGRSRPGRRRVQKEAAPVAVSPEQMVFEATQTPLFLVDATGKILAANPTMARFMRLPEKSLKGSSLLESRLSEFYPELAADLGACAVHRKSSHRLVRIPRDPAPAAQLMFWLAPVARGEDEDPLISGFVVPFMCNQGEEQDSL